MAVWYKSGKGVIQIAKESISKYLADAVVIPTNPNLEYADCGVQAAILRDGGPEIFREAEQVADAYRRKHGPTVIHDRQSKVPLFSAHLTNGGNLHASHVIHSVALGYTPESKSYCDKEIVAKSTKNALKLGKDHGLTSIGFVAFGTGIFQVPLEDSVEAMISEFEKHLADSTSIQRIGIVIPGWNDYLSAAAYLSRIKKVSSD